MSKIDDEIRRITIDINQAGNYFANGDSEGFKKNLHDVIDEIQEILNQI